MRHGALRPAALLLAAVLTAGAGACGSDDGALNPPGSTTSSTAETPATETTAAAPPPPATAAPTPTTESPVVDDGPPVVLRGDGLGTTLRFGIKVDEILAGLTLRWGPPESDTGWVPAGSTPFGTCPGTVVRATGWGPFYALFSDGPTSFGPAGRRHFFSWDYEVANPADPRPDPGGNRPTLRTEAGVSVAATVSDLQAAYGGSLELFDDSTEADGDGQTGPPGANPSFGVQTTNGGLYGSLTSLDAAGKVLTIIGGGGCGE
jgi:hypothetical protein